MFRELGEVLDAAEQPGLRHVAPAQLAAAAACVCDTKTASADTFVRLNEAKVRMQKQQHPSLVNIGSLLTGS